jgi:hypothetical protein
MATTKITETKIITIDGKKYLTFPQAWQFIGYKDRGVLHQRIMREEAQKENEKDPVGALNIEKYVFVPYDYCIRKKEEEENAKVLSRLKGKGIEEKDIDKLELIKKSGYTYEEIEKLLSQKKK